MTEQLNLQQNMTDNSTALQQLIERLKPLHIILSQNSYVKDITKRLNRIIEDASNQPIMLILGKERVGKTTLINSLIGRNLLEDSKSEVKLDVEHDTVWLNTMQMSQLFNREDSNIRRHVGNIFREGELDKGNNVRFLHVIGVKKPVPHLWFIRDIARRRNWISRSTILSTSQSSVCSCHIRFTTAI